MLAPSVLAVSKPRIRYPIAGGSFFKPISTLAQRT
jgi:hypothetical protein